MTHCIYMLECGDGTLYTGYTNRLEERIEAHKNGHAAKYTRGRGPFELVHVEEYDTKSEAMSREHSIKSLSRNEKVQLIQESSLDVSFKKK